MFWTWHDNKDFTVSTTVEQTYCQGSAPPNLTSSETSSAIVMWGQGLTPRNTQFTNNTSQKQQDCDYFCMMAFKQCAGLKLPPLVALSKAQQLCVNPRTCSYPLIPVIYPAMLQFHSLVSISLSSAPASWMLPSHKFIPQPKLQPVLKELTAMHVCYAPSSLHMLHSPCAELHSWLLTICPSCHFCMCSSHTVLLPGPLLSLLLLAATVFPHPNLA